MHIIHRPFLISILILLAATGCSKANITTKATHMNIKSTAFLEGENIPKIYTCDGDATPPPLSISGIPAETKSIALILEDPDAPGGTFVHWVLWNIDPHNAEIKNGTPPGASEGLNGAGKNAYYPPCPPSGSHRYFFRVYALDEKLDLPEKTTADSLQTSIKGRIIDEAELMGRYERQ